MSKYKLGDIFVGSYPITQKYGERPEYYKQFGLAGHEGVDWGTPTGVQVLAPFKRNIILRDNDDFKNNAYGNFIVIWDPEQKCAVWYCHLKENYVTVGQEFSYGTVLGLTDNSGNSSGPHLHVDFVETDGSGNRLNRTNGYQGFLNILDPNLVEWNLGGLPTPPVNEEVITDQTKIPQIDNLEVQAIRSMITALKQDAQSAHDRIGELDTRVGQLSEQVNQLTAQLQNSKLSPEDIKKLQDFVAWAQKFLQ